MKSIVVLKKYTNHQREVRLSFVNSLMPESGHLSDLELDSINVIIDKLALLVNSNNPSDYYEWGVDLYSVLSLKTVSHCRDDVMNEEYDDIPTQTLLDFMIELRNHKQQYQNISNLNSIVGQAFTQIKNNPSGTKKWAHGTYYELEISGIIVSLNLSEEDLNLNVSTYLNQIDANF
jgi:hypothetical protein